MPEQQKIAIIGGGIAGLTAATKLVQQGKQVTLFETSAKLGGRARTVMHQGIALDNGQHILLGAYHETLALMRSVDVDPAQALKRLPLALLVKDINTSAAFSLKASETLPAPLHIAWGILSAKGLNLSEKLNTFGFLAWLRIKQFKLKQDETLLGLLTRKKQPQKVMQCLWEPLCLAALNTPMVQASAQVFLNVLHDSFAKAKNDADLLLPTTDLSALLANPLADFITSNGGTVLTSTAINQLETTSDGYTLHYKGQSSTYSHIVIACGPHQFKHFNQQLPKLAQPHFDYQAITTVYLQYSPDSHLPQPMIGVVNSLTQWVFDRGQLYGQQGLIAVVISAYAPQVQDDLATTVSQELAQLFPDLGDVLWHQVITEKRATFSCDVNLDRPSNTTAYEHLVLAGDYTSGDYPATIEGAVRSGMSAASLI